MAHFVKDTLLLNMGERRLLGYRLKWVELSYVLSAHIRDRAWMVQRHLDDLCEETRRKRGERTLKWGSILITLVAIGMVLYLSALT